MTRRRPVQREKSEQAQIVGTLLMVGVPKDDIWVLGTRRSRGRACPNCGTFVPEHQGTRQTPGHPDVLAYVPKPAHRRDPGTPRCWLLYIECKAEGGRLRPEQRRFRELALDAGAEHIVGGLNDLLQWLLERGLVRESQIPHYRLPEARG